MSPHLPRTATPERGRLKGVKGVRGSRREGGKRVNEVNKGRNEGKNWRGLEGGRECGNEERKEEGVLEK